jgi:hypothetical protein
MVCTYLVINRSNTYSHTIYFIYIYMYIYIYWMYKYKYIYTYMYVYIYIYMHIYAYIYTYIYTLCIFFSLYRLFFSGPQSPKPQIMHKYPCL